MLFQLFENVDMFYTCLKVFQICDWVMGFVPVYEIKCVGDLS